MTTAFTLLDTTFALADVFTACFTEEQLLRLALTCSDLKKVLTPKYNFPITHAIKRDFNNTIKTLMCSRVIPSEETFEFILDQFQRCPDELLTCESVGTHILTSFAFWKRSNHTNILQTMVRVGLLQVGKVYRYHKSSLENYKLSTYEIRCNTGMKTCYLMKLYVSEEEKEEENARKAITEKKRIEIMRKFGL